MILEAINMVETKEDLINESCFVEARNVSNSTMRLIELNERRAAGDYVDDDIENERDTHTGAVLRLKKCILRESRR